MGFIFGSGTGSAALIAASGALRPNRRARAVTLLAGAALIIGASPTTQLDVEVVKLRSEKGVLRFCLTADPDNFPACVDDADAVTRTVPASVRSLRFDGLHPGGYALAIVHDENDNAKLDTIAGIPREGFGFSRNPALGFGPPRFDRARFAVGGDASVQQVRIRYIL